MSNFLAEVIQARDANTEDEFREMLSNVNMKLAQVQADLVESLQSCFVLYDADIDRVTSWYDELIGIHEKVQELRNQFYDDRKALKAATEDIESLSDELEHSDKTVDMLKDLVGVVRNIEKADPTTDYYKASQLVKEAQGSFKIIQKAFRCTEDHEWIIGIRSHIADLLTDIYEKVSGEIWSIFHFSKNSLSIKCTPCDMDPLVQTSINIECYKRIVNKLAFNFWQELLEKLCSQEYTLEVVGVSDGRFEELNSLDGFPGTDSIPVRDRNPQEIPSFLRNSNKKSTAKDISMKIVKLKVPNTKVDVVFSNISQIICVISDIFQQNAEVMDEFSRILGPRICDELGNKCLKTLILRNSEGSKAKAQTNMALMKSFLDHLGRLGFSFPCDTIFDDLEKNFESLFVSQLRQDLLIEIRDQIKANPHDTMEYYSEGKAVKCEFPEESAALQRNPMAFPKCTISKSVAKIVEALKKHMLRYKDDAAMCDAALTLYISLVKIPKTESETGDMVPLTAVLIHNNCHYLSHHACYTFPKCEDKVPELRAKANQAYSFMMRSVRSKLNTMIVESMSGIIAENASDTEKNKFLLISAEFQRLHDLFQGALTSNILHCTLATLVDHTVNEMCSKVLIWDDISANSANQLASAFTQFAIEASALFKGNVSNPREIEAIAAKCVSKWNRFRLLTFVLTASMKDIQDKWVEGCGPLAGEFKAEEIRKLVRALFQNTDRRAAFLSSIK